MNSSMLKHQKLVSMQHRGVNVINYPPLPYPKLPFLNHGLAVLCEGFLDITG